MGLCAYSNTLMTQSCFKTIFLRILVVHVVLVLIMRLNTRTYDGFWVPAAGCHIDIARHVQCLVAIFGTSQFLTSYSWLSAILTSSQPPSLSQMVVNWAKKC